MKNQFLIIIAFSGLASFGQTNLDEIKKINTREQVVAYLKDHPKVNGEIVEISSGDNSEGAKQIITNGIERPVVSGDHTYKVFETKKSSLLNAFYIYLDGSRLSLAQIDSVRQLIISKYNAGIPFADLAKEFNMDGNPDPNLKSIAEGFLVKDFSEAVKAHAKGEVFKIDVTDKKWYYVTQKTDNDQEAITYSVLKIKNSN
ncbi:MAG: hypothetical protein ACXVPN_09185 [Bacteroidia bacterium]